MILREAVDRAWIESEIRAGRPVQLLLAVVVDSPSDVPDDADNKQDDPVA
jgi:hypothetical protein